MEQRKKREEIAQKDTWDLTPIYASDDLWYEDFENAKKEVKKIPEFKNHIVRSAKDLLEYLTFDQQLDRKLNRLYYYVHLNFDADTGNTKYQTMDGKMNDLLKEVSELSSFIDSEFYSISYDTIESYYQEVPELQKYRHNLENLYRFQKHYLNEEEEKIVNQLSTSVNASEEIYESLTDTDLTFGTILDEQEKEVELSESNYGKYIASENRRVRKDAFHTLLGTYKKFQNTIAKTFQGNVESLISLSKIYHYSSSMEASLFSDKIEEKTYHNLIDTIHKHMDVVYQFFALKKEVLKLEEFHLYDGYAPLIEGTTKNYSFEEAKQIVCEALKPLGETYQKDLQKAFDERWIDIYPNIGKRSGAYSSGFYDTHPYVLLNYEGTLNSVSTLAHELGHSMHTYYSCKYNDYQNSSYKIFVAEVASTVNELLLNHYLLKNSKDKKEKLSILNHWMDLYKATIYRQVMFAEFERDMHKAKENGEILTSEFLSEAYYKLNQQYFGNDVFIDEEIRYEWERIPHFYYNFYVYKYAIGLSAASHIVKNILDGKEGALENYLKFLSLGGSDYPANELLVAGIDINQEEYIESAITMFQDLILEFKKLYFEK